MPATGGDITHVKTSAKTLAQLESIETANFDTGDLAIIRVLGRYYTLDKASTLPRDGNAVLYTKNARQSLNPAATPGRWIASCAYLSGCGGATGSSGSTGGAQGGGFANAIYWDDSGTTPGALTSWTQVYAAVQMNPGPSIIYLLSPGTIPAGTYELRYSRLTGETFGAPVPVFVQDGALLRNLTGVFGAVALISQSSMPVIDNDPSFPGDVEVFGIGDGAELINQGTSPMWILSSANGFSVLGVRNVGEMHVPSGVPIVHAPAGQSLLWGVSGQVGDPNAFDNGWASGDPTSALIILQDGTLASPTPTVIGFGSVTNNPRNGVGLPTAQRPGPVLGGPLQVDTTIFDTTLNRPIWWNGTMWVDADGLPA